VIFSAVFKVFTGMSGRRFTCDLEEAQRRGHIGHAPHHNSIFNYLESPKLTPILQALIVRSARPLRSIEVDFAVDSSGFETSRDGRWFEHAHGEKKERRQFIKCHLMCGVKTNVVVSVEISDSGDAVLLPGLVKTATEAFSIEEVSADKGYLSHRNTEAIVRAGGMPFIMPKVDSRGGGSDSWGRMFHYFQFREQEFLDHYHKRSNVESTFHMIKAKFGPGLFSRSDTALINEVLCKVLCHNLVVLNHEMLELKIDPSDWGSHPICEKEPSAESTVALVPVSEQAQLTPPAPKPPPAPGSPAKRDGLLRRGVRGIARLIIQAAQ
jgi:transposase